jgi:hypothetical protein
LTLLHQKYGAVAMILVRKQFKGGSSVGLSQRSVVFYPKILGFTLDFDI